MTPQQDRGVGIGYSLAPIRDLVHNLPERKPGQRRCLDTTPQLCGMACHDMSPRHGITPQAFLPLTTYHSLKHYLLTCVHSSPNRQWPTPVEQPKCRSDTQTYRQIGHCTHIYYLHMTLPQNLDTGVVITTCQPITSCHARYINGYKDLSRRVDVSMVRAL